ncbi:hypothetical protein [Carboxylicivirga linearis]|uniref:DUF4468 domain-containing protein n=1 Tax=Carboxylicivirga linearis TaxID=1628157 RepID=A0ABS5JT60_9BACT|nr:hypothetical protein [Carboxylicivirga linearis]MBS2098099.1 hypothetical protein [Carboxylicivirga linearis]
MKKYLLVTLLICSISTIAQTTKVKVNYKQDDVSVILDNTYLKSNPSDVKINFDVNKVLYFIKRGYYSQTVIVDSDRPYASLNIDLKPIDSNTKQEKEQFLIPDTLVITKTVTNFTRKELVEVMNTNFRNNNFIIGQDLNLFQVDISEKEDIRYKLAAEILNSNQIRSVYTKPRFVAASIQIRWTLLDIKNNTIAFRKTTNGAYMAEVNKTKGIVVGELMAKTMKKAIKEAQDQMFIDSDFRSIF